MIFSKSCSLENSSILTLAQLWQSTTLAEDGPTLYLVGPMQARVSFISYGGHKLTVRFTPHLPPLMQSSICTTSQWYRYYSKGRSSTCEQGPLLTVSGTTPGSCCGCRAGRSRIILEQWAWGYDWEVLQKKGVAEFEVKHSVLRKYKKDWSFGHEKGQCEPGEFLWLQHWGTRLRGGKDRRLDFLPNCSVFHVLQFEDSIVYKLGSMLFISQDFRGTLGLENYYFI